MSMKWLVRFFMKSVISVAQKAVVLSRKISVGIQKAIEALKSIPNEDLATYIADLEKVKDGVKAIEAVLVKILDKMGAEIPTEDGSVGTLSNGIEEVKKLL